MSGHLPNGNPVQSHSAGPVFPYVIVRQESFGVKTWQVIGPNHAGHKHLTYDAAHREAFLLKYNARLAAKAAVAA